MALGLNPLEQEVIDMTNEVARLEHILFYEKMVARKNVARVWTETGNLICVKKSVRLIKNACVPLCERNLFWATV